MTYMPINLTDINVDVSNDWDNRSMLITTDLWLNHSNTTATFPHSNYWGVAYDTTPVTLEDGWAL
ncbi:MAG: hypothetical protein CL991_01000, partial [Euryarchaeota archaeon]|nr:hypothetical protein [Euryarchaeota archaeon]